MPLIVTGTIGIDTVYTPTGHAEKVMGGSCSYFAAAAQFYCPVRLVAAVGSDWPAAHRATLARFSNIDASGLEVREGSKTFAWGGRYHVNMNSRETLYTELGVLTERPPGVPAHFRDSEVVFLANTHPAVQMNLLLQFPKRRLAVADTMDLWINSARAELAELLQHVDGLVLNYDEAELLTQKSNAVSAGRQILQMGPKFVVIKKGEHGCLFIHRYGIGALPAFPAERVIDPTGAGDSFAGGMMGYLAGEAGNRTKAAGDDLASYDAVRRALAYGTVAASFTIESFSLDRLASLTRPELDARYDEFTRMVRI